MEAKHSFMCSFGVYTSLPIGENILETDKQLPNHVQFIDSGVDGVLTWSTSLESVSVGNS